MMDMQILKDDILVFMSSKNSTFKDLYWEVRHNGFHAVGDEEKVTSDELSKALIELMKSNLVTINKNGEFLVTLMGAKHAYYFMDSDRRSYAGLEDSLEDYLIELDMVECTSHGTDLLKKECEVCREIQLNEKVYNHLMKAEEEIGCALMELAGIDAKGPGSFYYRVENLLDVIHDLNQQEA